MKLDLNNEAKKTVLFTKLVEQERQQMIVEKRLAISEDFNENDVKVSDERQDEIASNVVIEYTKINTKLSKDKRELKELKEKRDNTMYTQPLNFDAYNDLTKKIAVKGAYVKNLEKFIDTVFSEKFNGEK